MMLCLHITCGPYAHNPLAQAPHCRQNDLEHQSQLYQTPVGAQLPMGIKSNLFGFVYKVIDNMTLIYT